jgi:hypothetical protein
MAKKSTRKNRRTSTRRNRRASRRCWSRRQSGGQCGMPRRRQSGGQCGMPRRQSGGMAPVNMPSLLSPSSASLAQGQDYARLHMGQHGGAAVSLAAAAPVGYTGMLDDSLRATARVTPLDQSIGAIQGMRDQSGGGRRRRGGKLVGKRGGKKPSKAMRRRLIAATRKLKSLKVRLLKSLRKMSRRGRRQRGGSGYQYANQADYGAPGMLLSPAQEAKALMGMNPEWRLAANPASFAPSR